MNTLISIILVTFLHREFWSTWKGFFCLVGSFALNSSVNVRMIKIPFSFTPVEVTTIGFHW